jgi:transcriptional regulator with XRE-family HTH domain
MNLIEQPTTSVEPNRLRVLRAKRRVSQLRLALDTGIHPTRLWRLENGLRVPTSADRAALAAYFSVAETEIWPEGTKR